MSRQVPSDLYAALKAWRRILIARSDLSNRLEGFGKRGNGTEDSDSLWRRIHASDALEAQKCAQVMAIMSHWEPENEEGEQEYGIEDRKDDF